MGRPFSQPWGTLRGQVLKLLEDHSHRFAGFGEIDVQDFRTVFGKIPSYGSRLLISIAGGSHTDEEMMSTGGEGDAARWLIAPAKE